MKNLSKIVFLVSATLAVYFAIKWHREANSFYEPIVAIFGGIAVVSAYFMGSNSNLARSSSFIFGNKNKVKQKANKKDSNSTILGSENELEQ